jgi:hypothetical protein
LEDIVLADIVNGEVDWADFCFLVAVILAVIAAYFFSRPTVQMGHTLLSVAVALIAAGFLLL